MPEAVGLGVLALVALAALAVSKRHGERSKLTLSERLVRALYRWAKWWGSVAVAADKAVLHFRMEMQLTGEVQPECEYMEGRR